MKRVRGSHLYEKNNVKYFLIDCTVGVAASANLDYAQRAF